MLLPRRTLLASLLITALLTAGCGEMITNLSELSKVESYLSKTFGETVSVNVTAHEAGLTLMVWFINSGLIDQSEEARQRRAAEAAKLVKESYVRIQNVREIWVGYLRQKTRHVVFRSSQIVEMHGFDNNAQPLPSPDSTNWTDPPNLQVTPTYDSRNDQTDISATAIQLEGQPGGLGITLLPYFKVSGSVRDGKRPPPKTVSLNFASYSEKPRFAQTTPITFVADGKVALKREGRFTGHDAQFCYLNVSYKEYLRIVGGNELVVKLGDKEYPLTPNQLGAMRAMTGYVAE